MAKWILIASTCAVLKAAAMGVFMFPHVPIAALPLLALRQVTFAWIWMTYLFCAGIHGYGLLSIAGTAMWIILIPEILIAPFQVAALGQQGDWFPVLWCIQILVNGWLGSIFYVSFLRAAPLPVADAAVAST